MGNEAWVDMKVYIVDDERTSIKQIEKYINEYAEKIGVSMEARGFTDAGGVLQEYEKSEEKPYLVFVAIAMKQISGMDIARKLREKGSDVRLIFTDTSDEYAIQAFDVQADGYLKKPVTYQDFSKAMRRFRARFTMESHTIQIRSERKEVNLYTADIYYAEVIGHSVWIYSKRGNYKTTLTMGRLVELLQEEKQFLACGRSYLVNMAYIKKVNNDMIEMKAGNQIPIPVRVRKNIAEQYQKYRDGK